MIDSPGPLQTATLEELMDELARRSPNGIVAVSGHNPKHDGLFAVKTWGSNIWAAGMCVYIKRQALDLIDTEDVDDALEP